MGMMILAAVLLTRSSNINVYLNDRMVPMDATPVMQGSRVLVPLRAVGEALGSNVTYDPGQNSINIRRGSNIINMRLRVRDAMANGKPIMLDQPPVVQRGRVLVPLRTISEFFGAKVKWDAKARRVDVRI